MSKLLDIAKIRTDGGTQSRASLDGDVIIEYSDAMLDGAKFPPVVVFYDGSEYWLADGFHRVDGAIAAGIEKIAADVKQGTQRDAILYSCGANAANGVRRTNDDKRRAVEILLRDSEWVKWSDNKISKQCGVACSFVGDVRRIISPTKDESRKVERNGKVYEQNTANIGKHKITTTIKEEIDLPAEDDADPLQQAARGDITPQEMIARSQDSDLSELQALRQIEIQARKLHAKLMQIPLAKQIPEVEALGIVLAQWKHS